jgi:hypothetical protein
LNSSVTSSVGQVEAWHPTMQSGPPAVVGKAHDKQACGAIGRRAGQLGHVRIAAYDPVHDDDIGGFNLGPSLGEVHQSSLDAIAQAGLD